MCSDQLGTVGRRGWIGVLADHPARAGGMPNAGGSARFRLEPSLSPMNPPLGVLFSLPFESFPARMNQASRAHLICRYSYYLQMGMPSN